MQQLEEVEEVEEVEEEEEKLSGDNRIVSQRRMTGVLHNSATEPQLMPRTQPTRQIEPTALRNLFPRELLLSSESSFYHQK